MCPAQPLHYIPIAIIHIEHLRVRLSSGISQYQHVANRFFIIMSENILFESPFTIIEINSAKYDRVSRIKAKSNDKETELMLDVNTELYPVNVEDNVTIALSLSLNLDGSKDDSKGWREVGMGEQTLANEYDYVCHGKIYRFEEGTGDNM
jgi:DNA-directed RNA polymerase I, II, and III subunit RPABC3